MNKRFRIISLMSEALGLEYEEVVDRDRKYEEEFQKEFSEEIRYLTHLQNEKIKKRGNIPDTENSRKNFDFEENRETQDVQQPQVIKDIYRALAKSTHPDIAGMELTETFQQIQKAYSTGDLITLMSKANEYFVAPEISEEDLETLQESLEAQKKKIELIKSTVRWQWGISDKSHTIRAIIAETLGIDRSVFSNWKAGETLARRKREREQRARSEQMAKEERLRRERREQERKKRTNQSTGGRNLARARDLRKRRKK